MRRTQIAFFIISMLLTLPACAYSPDDTRPPEVISSSASAAYGASGDMPVWSDVPDGAWYAEAVQYCLEHGLMDGTSSAAFSPAEPATRAVLVTALYRQAGSPAVRQRAGFTDVPAGASYADAVSWAAANSIAGGYGDGRFGGEAPVTREQFAAMLWRTEKQPDPEGSEVFADHSEISAYAVDAVAWAKSAGIISGRGNNLFDPKADITRGEVAVMLYRWLNPAAEGLPYDGVYPRHEPCGTGIGAMPGRVVWAHDPDSVDWDGEGYWWELDNFNEAIIQRMVDASIASLGGKDTPREGWTALFQAHNGGRGYAAGEKIAIKANINGSGVMDDDTSGETRMSYTNPVLLKALLTSLVEDAGVAPSDITVYDVSRLFPDYMKELCTGGNLRGVNFVGRNNGVADEDAPILWSHPFSGKVNYLPTCVTEAAYVINLANLKGHSYGITLCGKNHFGSFINGNMMRPPEGANLHQWLTRNEMGIYSPLADLMANADLGGKTVLYMLDALICAPSEGASITGENSRWQQAPFSGDYTSSVFVSQDPVAIDSVGADFLMNEPAVTGRNGSLRDNATVENYLHEAGLVSAAPSGTVYTDSRGHAVDNLGVHEHWNNSAQKQYSRNLGKNEGIELIFLEPV